MNHDDETPSSLRFKWFLSHQHWILFTLGIALGLAAIARRCAS